MTSLLLALSLLLTDPANAMGNNLTPQECRLKLMEQEAAAKLQRAALIERSRTMTGLREIFLPLVRKLQKGSSELDRPVVETLLKKYREKLIVKRFPYTNMYSHHSLQYTVQGSPAAQEWLTWARKVHVNNQWNGETSRGSSWTSFTGQHREFYLAIPKDGKDTTGLNHLRVQEDAALFSALTPVGEYGNSFAVSNLFTQQILLEHAHTLLAPALPELTEKYRPFLLAHTQRAKDMPMDIAVMGSIHEGILTMNQAVSLLLARKIPGISDYREGLKMLLTQPEGGTTRNVLVDFVQRLSMGNIGPLTLGGRYNPRALRMNADGTLALTEELKTNLGEMKRIRQEELSQPWEDSHDTGVGCPMGFSKGSGDSLSGIEYAAMLYYHTFIQVDDLIRAGALR